MFPFNVKIKGRTKTDVIQYKTLRYWLRIHKGEIDSSIKKNIMDWLLYGRKPDIIPCEECPYYDSKSTTCKDLKDVPYCRKI